MTTPPDVGAPPRRLPDDDPEVRPPHFLRWPVQLGVAGFLPGFFGPIVLNPGANQGPLLGILITGPAGFLLGFVLGLLALFFRRRGMLLRRTLTALTLTALAIALALVAYSIF